MRPWTWMGWSTSSRGIESGEIEMRFVESVEPSPLAHGILTGRPYTFLDGAPLEERRSRAVAIPRGLAPRPDLAVEPNELAPLDPDAVRVVLEQLAPDPRDPDELHDLLLSLVIARPVERWRPLFEALVASGRASVVDGCWVPTERFETAASITTDDEAAAACVNGHLEVAGPISLEALVADEPFAVGTVRGVPLSMARARTALARLEGAGSAIELPGGQWCARHLARADACGQPEPPAQPGGAGEHRPVRAVPGPLAARRSGYPVRGAERPSAGHRAAGRHRGRCGRVGVPGSPARGCGLPAALARRAVPLRRGVLGPAVAPDRRSRRVRRHAPCGDDPVARHAAHARPARGPGLAAGGGARSASPRPSRCVGAAADVLEALRSRGACSAPSFQRPPGRMPNEVDEGLWDLVARGLVTADAFSAVRSLLNARRVRGTSADPSADAPPGPGQAPDPRRIRDR